MVSPRGSQAVNRVVSAIDPPSATFPGVPVTVGAAFPALSTENESPAVASWDMLTSKVVFQP